MMTFISSYFKWLQKDCPTGLVDKYPELDSDGQTSLKGCYVVGDLTGVPLLKLAAEGGAQIIRKFSYDKSFSDIRNKENGIYDVIIIGGGPAGISAAIECKKRKLSYLLLEGSKLFNSIENFPKGKPILAKPDDFTNTSELNLKDGIKESLLDDLNASVADHDLNIEINARVESIKSAGKYLLVHRKDKSYKALRVVLAIGKSGDSRRLNVPGEEKDKVFNRIFDPAEFLNKNILVVGGGDSALETAIALAEVNNKVTISYRGKEFSRPKEENMLKVKEWQDKGRIEVIYSSSVIEIHENKVELDTENGTQEIKNDNVFVLIGRELPIQFFKRSKIRIEGEKSTSWYVFLTAMVSFFTMLYFGKSGSAVTSLSEANGVLEIITAFFKAPFSGLEGRWLSVMSFVLGWLGAIVFAVSGVWAFLLMVKERDKYFKKGWPLIKYGYITIAALFFTYIYIDTHLAADKKSGWASQTTYWYSFLYCSTMFLFALRRAYVKKTRYIKWQMTCLVSIQVLFLFLLPFHIYPYLENALGKDHIIIQQVFPSGGWSSFALILFWPLNMWEFGSTTFWTIFPFIQTFVLLPILIKFWGKGVYCGWICSCGGMAETFGDEYRNKSPHGPKAKKMENIGQWILAYAILTTLIVFFTKNNFYALSETTKEVYKLLIDIFFAGVLGLGVYFFMGGRIWCRYGCPLAALMHIYTRFSRYRIVSEKKKCISCNICTKVCHMGIDVMNFANKGIPMNDAECVRCSTCITSCPMDVLSFATLKKGDPENKEKIEIPSYGKDNWKAGLK